MRTILGIGSALVLTAGLLVASPAGAAHPQQVAAASYPCHSWTIYREVIHQESIYDYGQATVTSVNFDLMTYRRDCDGFRGDCHFLEWLTWCSYYTFREFVWVADSSAAYMQIDIEARGCIAFGICDLSWDGASKIVQNTVYDSVWEPGSVYIGAGSLVTAQANDRFSIAPQTYAWSANFSPHSPSTYQSTTAP